MNIYEDWVYVRFALPGYCVVCEVFAPYEHTTPSPTGQIGGQLALATYSEDKRQWRLTTSGHPLLPFSPHQWRVSRCNQMNIADKVIR